MRLFCFLGGPNLTEQDFDALFRPHGSIKSIKVPRDHETGKTKGFGFIEMPDAAAALAAIRALDGARQGKRKITVNLARARKAREEAREETTA